MTEDQHPDTPARPDYMVTYDDFWADLVETDGHLDLDKVARELSDYRRLMESASSVYSELADLSKPLTAAHVVIGEANRRTEEAIEEAVREETEDLVSERDRLSVALRGMARRSVAWTQLANAWKRDLSAAASALGVDPDRARMVGAVEELRRDLGLALSGPEACGALMDRVVDSELARLRAELDRLHSWAGLIELLDEHWPADIFPGGGESGDLGPRVVGLIRECDRLRVENERLRNAWKADPGRTLTGYECNAVMPPPAPGFRGIVLCRLKRGHDGQHESNQYRWRSAAPDTSGLPPCGCKARCHWEEDPAEARNPQRACRRQEKPL